MAKQTLADISAFLGCGRIAVIGVSRNAKSFSRTLYRAFIEHGYDVVPVNPNAAEIEGRTCFAHPQAINPPVEAALLMTAPGAAVNTLKACREAGIRRVWLYGLNGPGKASEAAAEFCAANEMELIRGYCPFMFLPNPGIIHRCHRGVMRLMGSYPQ